MNSLVTHEKHSVGDLVLAHTATKNDHTRLLGLDAHVVETANVTDNVNAQRGGVGLVGVEVHHVTERTVSERRAEDWDVVLNVSSDQRCKSSPSSTSSKRSPRC